MIRLNASFPDTALLSLLSAAGLTLALIPTALPAQVLKGQSEDAVISGTVTDDFGTPLRDIRVLIYRDEGSVATARTDKAGKFAATVPASASPVRLSFEEMSDLEDRAITFQWYDHAYRSDEADLVSFGAAEEVVLDVSLSRNAVFTGTVVDHEGEPLSGVTIRFRDDYDYCCTINSETRTDEEGRYVDHVPTVSGSTKIEVSGGSAYQTLYYGGHSLSTQERVPAPRNDTVSMDFALKLNPPEITGLVTEAGDYPEESLPDIKVVAVADDGYRVSTTTNTSGFYSLPLAKAEGPVRLGFVDEPGSYEEEWHPDQPGPESAEPLTVGPGAPLRIDAVLEPSEAPADVPEGAITISGAVTDEAGNPLPNLLMDVWSGDANPEAGDGPANQFPTGPDGSFEQVSLGSVEEVGDSIRIGLYLGMLLGDPFTGYWQGYTGTERVAASISEAVAIPIVPGDNRVNLVVNMPALITGKVTDETGDPISRISVTAWRSGLETTDEGGAVHDGSGRLFITSTYDDGRYAELVAPADGSTKIQFGHASSAEVSSQFHRDAATYADAEEISLDPGGRITVDAVLERAYDPSTGGVIAGTVSTAAGDPLRDIEVSIYDGGDLHYRTRTDKRGEFHRPVAPSERGYHLQFVDTSEPNDFVAEWFDDAHVRTSAAAVPVAAGEEVSIDVELAMAYATITGTVTDDAGRALEGVEVYFCNLENAEVSSSDVTDENGRYELSVFHAHSGGLHFLASSDYVSEWYDDLEASPIYCLPPTEGEPRRFELQPRDEITADAVLARAADTSGDGSGDGAADPDADGDEDTAQRGAAATAGASLEGDWVRRDSNNPRNDGMRVNVSGTSATLIHLPPSGSRRHSVGQVQWKGFRGTGSMQVRGSDGQYYPASATLEGDVLQIDVSANGPGNDQTWERAGPSIQGEWVLVGPSGDSNEGVRVQVEGDEAVLRYVTATSDRSLRIGEIVWRDIGAGQLEARTDGGDYAPSEFELLDADRLRVRTAGVTRTWARPGAAEDVAAELAAATDGVHDAAGDHAGDGDDLWSPRRAMMDLTSIRADATLEGPGDEPWLALVEFTFRLGEVFWANLRPSPAIAHAKDRNYLGEGETHVIEDASYVIEGVEPLTVFGLVPIVIEQDGSDEASRRRAARCVRQETFDALRRLNDFEPDYADRSENNIANVSRLILDRMVRLNRALQASIHEECQDLLGGQTLFRPIAAYRMHVPGVSDEKIREWINDGPGGKLSPDGESFELSVRAATDPLIGTPVPANYTFTGRLRLVLP